MNNKFDTDLEEDEREKIVEKEQEEREKEIGEHLKIQGVDERDRSAPE